MTAAVDWRAALERLGGDEVLPAVALNLLAQPKLSTAMVAAQVQHAARRDSERVSFTAWLDVLEASERRGLPSERPLALQEALGLDAASID